MLSHDGALSSPSPALRERVGVRVVPPHRTLPPPRVGRVQPAIPPIRNKNHPQRATKASEPPTPGHCEAHPKQSINSAT